MLIKKNSLKLWIVGPTLGFLRRNYHLNRFLCFKELMKEFLEREKEDSIIQILLVDSCESAL